MFDFEAFLLRPVLFLRKRTHLNFNDEENIWPWGWGNNRRMEKIASRGASTHIYMCVCTSNVLFPRDFQIKIRYIRGARTANGTALCH